MKSYSWETAKRSNEPVFTESKTSFVLIEYMLKWNKCIYVLKKTQNHIWRNIVIMISELIHIPHMANNIF